MAKKIKGKKNNKINKNKSKINKEKSETTASLDTENVENISQSIKRCSHLRKMVTNKNINNTLENAASLSFCDECKIEKPENKDIYMCLSCGKLFCGKSDENHVNHHFETVSHCVFINIYSQVFYCCLCNEEILYNSNVNQILVDVKNIFVNYDKMKKAEEINGIRKERMKENVKRSAIYPGLRNLKHTCFFNSVMQCLTYTKPFEGIINDTLKLEEGPLSNAFVSFLKTMNQKLKMSEEKQNNGIKFRQEVFEPLELFNAIIAKWDQYEGFEQQDSHELLRHLLDGIRDEQINALKEKGEENKKTFIDEIFGGKLVNYIICDSCKIIKSVYEPFYDLSVPIVDNNKIENETDNTIGPDKKNIEEKFENEEYPLVNDEKNKKDIECILNDIIIEKKENDNVLSIRDCIKQFMNIETLEGSEACVCNNCTKIRYGEQKDEDSKNKKVVYRRIQKRYFVENTPKILVVNIKRFIIMDNYGHVVKSDKFVDFQQFLKLNPYLSPIDHDKDSQHFYRLYGVVVHSGFSIQSGHYFSYISRKMGEWFYASDSIIRPSDWNEVKRSLPYLLFYEIVK